MCIALKNERGAIDGVSSRPVRRIAVRAAAGASQNEGYPTLLPLTALRSHGSTQSIIQLPGSAPQLRSKLSRIFRPVPY